jgi:hypothetical protein
MTGRQNNSGIRYRWFHIYSFSKSYDSVNAFNELMIQILVLKGFFFPWKHKQTLKPVIFYDLSIKYKQPSIRIHCLLIVWILKLHAVFFQKKSFGKKKLWNNAPRHSKHLSWLNSGNWKSRWEKLKETFHSLVLWISKKDSICNSCRGWFMWK